MRTITKEIDFAGPFAKAAKDFILFKQSMGFRYHAETVVMRRFCVEYSSVSGLALDKELVLSWCKKSESECTLTQRQRMRVIRQFAMYLEMMGHEAYILPKQVGRTTARVYTPYIFTREEMQRLFASIDELAARTRGLGPQVYPLLMRMLYGCGLRISEALTLRVRDVDTQQGILTLYNSKFGKDRLVPMSPSLTRLCETYAESNLRFTAADAFFFPAPDGGIYSARTVYHHFRAMLGKSGIPHMGKGKGPRMHDLRHTFAVHRLNRWVEEGKDLFAVLPILAAYLGHESILMTQRYLRLTAEVYPALIKTVENFCQGVIPAFEDAI